MARKKKSKAKPSLSKETAELSSEQQPLESFRQGMLLVQQDKVEEACSLWAIWYAQAPESIHADKELVRAMRALREQFVEEGGIKRALTEFKEHYKPEASSALIFHRLFTRFYFSVGLIPQLFVEAQGLEAEAELWRQRLKKLADYPYARFRLGVCYTLQGKLAPALDLLTQCRDELLAPKRAGLRLDESIDFTRSVLRIVANEPLETGYAGAFGEWEQAGFTEFAEREAWTKTGFTPQEARLLCERGVTPDSAKQWLRQKMQAQAIITWHDAGFTDPMQARLWYRAGVDVQVAREWSEKFNKPTELAVQCYTAGLRNAERANQWMKVFVLPGEALRWEQLGFEPAEAVLWIGEGVTHPEVALEQKRILEQDAADSTSSEEPERSADPDDGHSES